MSKEDNDLADDDWQFLDSVSALCQQGDAALPVLRSICDEDERVKLPPGWQP